MKLPVHTPNELVLTNRVVVLKFLLQTLNIIPPLLCHHHVRLNEAEHCPQNHKMKSFPHGYNHAARPTIEKEIIFFIKCI